MSTTVPPIKTNGGAKKEQPVVEVVDLVHTALVAVYLVQKLGRPTLKEIQEHAKTKVFAKLDGRMLGRALRGASRRNMIAILQERISDGRGNQVVDVFSMKDPQRWKAPPEYCQFTELLPKLLSTPELAELKKGLDAGEVDNPEKGAKARRGNDIDEYRNYSVLIYTLDPLLGSQIHCPYTDFARGSKPTTHGDKPDMEGIFVVDEITGDRLLTSDCLGGWFVSNCARYAGMAEARGSYYAFKPIHIPASVKPIQLVLPVNNAKQGASAPKSYECIPARQLLRMDFTGPAKGGFSPAQLEKLFHLVGDRPRRGISPARGRRFGRFLVIDFKDLGPVKTGGLDFILDNLPDDVRAKMGRPAEPTPTELTDKHFTYLSGAVDRLRGVDINPTGYKPIPEEEDEGEDDED